MRIGINVPNELLERVKGIRPEVNVSQICREALEGYARKAEEIADNVVRDGMEAEINRLAESEKRPIIEPDWIGFALEDARDWVRNANVEEWENFCHQRDVLEKQGRGHENWHAESSRQEGVKDFVSRYYENKEWFIKQYEIDMNSNAYKISRDEYCRTWMAYVEEVRRLVELRRRDEREKVMAERRKNRQILREPLIPPQLQEW